MQGNKLSQFPQSECSTASEPEKGRSVALPWMPKVPRRGSVTPIAVMPNFLEAEMDRLVLIPVQGLICLMCFGYFNARSTGTRAG